MTEFEKSGTISTEIREEQPAVPTVQQLYDESTKLSDRDREELAGMIIDGLAPEPPNTFHTESEMEAMLSKATDSPMREVTPETWKQAHAELERRLQNPAP